MSATIDRINTIKVTINAKMVYVVPNAQALGFPSQAFLRHFSGIYQAFFRHLSGISQASLRRLSGISWSFLGISYQASLSLYPECKAGL